MIGSMSIEVEVEAGRNQPITPRALKGIEYFNRGLFFDAHEELEAAWRAEPGPIRNLYRGILQVAVAYYHLERNNLPGAMKVFSRSRRWLLPYNGIWMGIDLDRFKSDAERIETLTRLLQNRGRFHPPPDWPPKIIIH
jgi:hypothetical protein